MVDTCRLWVLNADWHTAVRADRILALRVTVQPAAGENYGPFHLEAVTADAVGEHGGPTARLCSGRSETFPDDAPAALLRLIARHLDNPDGGIIDCGHEDTAQEDPGLGGMFRFRSFAEQAGGGPRRLR